MLAIVAAVILQQAATGQVVWQEPAPPAPIVADAPAAPAVPDWARADPYGYERSECSPLMRKANESMEACQARVRAALALDLGPALPPGLAAGGGAAEQCRQEAAGDRYALQCGAPGRSAPGGPRLVERTCETRPRAQAQGGVVWTEECRPADGSEPPEEGLRIRLGGED
ncbi:hypothetical protein N0B44_30690 [Roseibacterium beibuensis]|uniref:hypothetical protein n=1 Tax=[Roseibacterium] beibuensis TaxID=1193142 RepID=UPI00217E36B1|nr:hypothetical protein [Roseibacterium beibuensis]MCS6627283.1 hypothetical protein [Roseibacterium beibuensis]